jgi:hypothetical protein
MPPATYSNACVSLLGGLVEHGGRRLRSAELTPLTGFEEEWLAANPTVASAPAVTRLLSSCLKRLGDVEPTVDHVRRLLVADREYLMLQLRRITLGEVIAAVLDCPACGAKIDVDFSIESIPVERRPLDADIFLVEGDARTLRFRLPVGADQESVCDLSEEEAAAALLQHCLLDPPAPPLTIEEREAIVTAMERLAPKVDLELDVICPECGHSFLMPFDTTSFILQEFRTSGQQLLREVHSLALLYHWSERDILGLRRDRRRAYLDLLSDAMRTS